MDCTGRPLNLSVTLASGQSFRWRRDAEGVWWGVVGRTAIAARQAEGEPESPLFWQTFPEPDKADLIADYFRFEMDLEARSREWIAAEPRIEEPLRTFRGLRILRQPPEECLFGFLCATAKPVDQIERLVWNLAARYGERMTLTDAPNTPPLYIFPTLEALAAAPESELRAASWGYRAPRIPANARQILTQPTGWLEGLRSVPFSAARAELMQLSGIGPKVADCICLFSLDKDDSAPVDRHLQRIACRFYRPDLEGKSLTPANYEALADCYRETFGAYAGWAQQYLFYGELRRAAQQT